MRSCTSEANMPASLRGQRCTCGGSATARSAATKEEMTTAQQHNGDGCAAMASSGPQLATCGTARRHSSTAQRCIAAHRCAAPCSMGGARRGAAARCRSCSRRRQTSTRAHRHTSPLQSPSPHTQSTLARQVDVACCATCVCCMLHDRWTLHVARHVSVVCCATGGRHSVCTSTRRPKSSLQPTLRRLQRAPRSALYCCTLC